MPTSACTTRRSITKTLSTCATSTDARGLPPRCRLPTTSTRSLCAPFATHSTSHPLPRWVVEDERPAVNNTCARVRYPSELTVRLENQLRCLLQLFFRIVDRARLRMRSRQLFDIANETTLFCFRDYIRKRVTHSCAV